MPGVTQLSLPRLGFAIQAAGPRACVLSHLCLKSRCGTISPGMENFVTQKVGHVSARRALPVFSLCGTLCFSSADYVPSFPECPQELPPSPECRAPSGKKALEDVGIASHQRERGGDRLRCPPLHVQAGAGREARTSSKRRAPRPEQGTKEAHGTDGATAVHRQSPGQRAAGGDGGPSRPRSEMALRTWLPCTLGRRAWARWPAG